jgi:hypothetical protein
MGILQLRQKRLRVNGYDSSDPLVLIEFVAVASRASLDH